MGKKQKSAVVVPISKPRDPNWKVLAACKGGAHGPTPKAKRRSEKIRLQAATRGAKGPEDFFGPFAFGAPARACPLHKKSFFAGP